jgi:hypothetical protein
MKRSQYRSVRLVLRPCVLLTHLSIRLRSLKPLTDTAQR